MFTGNYVLITGGAGFIGSWLCDYFIENGAYVYSVDNMSTGSWDNIRHLKKVEEKFYQMVYDVSNPDIIDELDGIPFDYIFHMASPASPLDFSEKPIEILDVNTIGTKNMLEVARKVDSTLVFASTSEAYGDPPKSELPLKETYRGNVNSVGVRGCYDESKRVGEAYCMAYARKFNVSTRIARIFNTFGEKMPKDGRVMPTFISRALNNYPIPIFGDGTQTRTFLYIEDLIAGLVSMIQNEVPNTPINLGGTEEITIVDLAELIIEMTNSKSDLEYLPPMPDDPARRKPDISKAKEWLNWQPAIPYKEGIRQTLLSWK